MRSLRVTFTACRSRMVRLSSGAHNLLNTGSERRMRARLNAPRLIIVCRFSRYPQTLFLISRRDIYALHRLPTGWC